MPNAGGGVKFEAQLALLPAGGGEFIFCPTGEFTDELGGAVARGGDLFQALLERQFALDSPEHDGKFERDFTGRFTGGCARDCGDGALDGNSDGGDGGFSSEL